MIFREKEFIHSVFSADWEDFFISLNTTYKNGFTISKAVINCEGQKLKLGIKELKSSDLVSFSRIIKSTKFSFELNYSSQGTVESFFKNILKLEIDKFINQILNVHLEHHIYKDDLTEVHNYRCLHKDVTDLIENKKSDQFTLAFIDLDNFKAVNDKHGHIVGSSLLKQVSEKFLEFKKSESMTIYRYGGDEFVVLLNSKNEDASKKELVPLIEKITGSTFYISKDLEYKAELSIGFAEFPRDGQNFSEIVAIADMMMYEAKKSDRNITDIRFKKIKKVS